MSLCVSWRVPLFSVCSPCFRLEDGPVWLGLPHPHLGNRDPDDFYIILLNAPKCRQNVCMQHRDLHVKTLSLNWKNSDLTMTESERFNVTGRWEAIVFHSAAGDGEGQRAAPVAAPLVEGSEGPAQRLAPAWRGVALMPEVLGDLQRDSDLCRAPGGKCTGEQ